MQHLLLFEMMYSMAKKQANHFRLDAAVSALATAVARQFLGSCSFFHGLQGKQAINLICSNIPASASMNEKAAWNMP